MIQDYKCPNCGASFSLPLGMTCNDHHPEPITKEPAMASPVKFRKKPVVIEAMPLNDGNAQDVCDWITSCLSADEPHAGRPTSIHDGDGAIIVHTLEGDMRADPGDWIICGVAGEFYPCKPGIFTATYEQVRDHDHTGPGPLMAAPPEPGSRPDFVAGSEPEAIYERAIFAGLTVEWALAVAGIRNAEGRFCCFIPCSASADVMIVSNTGHPEDTTDSCLAHVGDMLGSSMTDREWDTFDYTVVPLGSVAPES